MGTIIKKIKAKVVYYFTLATNPMKLVRLNTCAKHSIPYEIKNMWLPWYEGQYVDKYVAPKNIEGRRIYDFDTIRAAKEGDIILLLVGGGDMFYYTCTKIKKLTDTDGLIDPYEYSFVFHHVL